MREYSTADQEYCDHLLPLEGLDFSSADEIEIDPIEETGDERRRRPPVEIREQDAVELAEIPLLADEEAIELLRRLKSRGYSVDELQQAYGQLERVPVTKVRERQAKRASLDTRIRTEVGRILR